MSQPKADELYLLLKINTKNIEYDNEKMQNSQMFPLYKYHKDQVLQIP